MEFYPHRTIEEQAERLQSQGFSFEFTEKYKNTALDRIEIDGCEIQGYFEYSFMEEKSYHDQPVRSQDGTIELIDEYTSFLTPRIIIRYNMMHIDDYRTLMTFLKSKNSFKVTCYDIVADRRVTHEMYFAPPQMPVIYQRYLAAMGVTDYTIELIGTNRRVDDDKISFTLDGVEMSAYSNDSWLSYVLRESIGYKVEYSTVIKQFVVTADNGETAICYKGGGFVSPNHAILNRRVYEVLSV